MKPNTFRIIVVSLSALAFLILLAIAVFVFMQSRKCPVSSCPKVSCTLPSYPTSEYRDRRVISDQLYPPLNRTDEQNYIAISRQVQSGQLYQITNDSKDSFRLVGYLSNDEPVQDAGGNNWKLFARMKDRNQGEFYIIPTNNNIDLKIPLTNEIVVSQKLKDIYTLPKEMLFNCPMLNKGPYVFTEIPKADLGSSLYM